MIAARNIRLLLLKQLDKCIQKITVQEEKMIDLKSQFLTEPDVEAENQKLHSEWMIEHIRANAAEERVRQLEDFILGANFSSLPEPPSEITEGNVYIWSGKHNVYTAPGKSVLLPVDLPRDLKAEDAIELGKFLYAAGQISKGTK